MSGTGPPVRLFIYSPTRSAAQAAALYAGIKPGAALMTDGYEPYNDVADKNQLVHLGCWAHARRYMIEAEENLPKGQRGRDHPVSELIRLIGQLFAIESRCKGKAPAERLLERQRESRSVRISDERDRPFRDGDRRFRQRDRSFRKRDRADRKAGLALRMTSTTRAMLAGFGRRDDARAPDEHAHVYERLPFAKQKCTLTGRWTAAVYPALMQCKTHTAGPDEMRLLAPL
ncbi:transposase [Paraburkholderia phenoliruptrix]|uniref:Transposase n=1 Tax=Paraburkholderia phenoliruptrix TaxID=252970 RepID=A0ABV3WKZ0_9BURK